MKKWDFTATKYKKHSKYVPDLMQEMFQEQTLLDHNLKQKPLPSA